MDAHANYNWPTLATGFMSAAPLDRYRKLMNELLFVREAEGGQLSDELESSYVERLEELWWTLSESEQKEYEADRVGPGALGGPEHLDLVDRAVHEGDDTGPREAH
ncbi:MAG: hypothetical protein KC776_19045 [Myxococcales bacterium]|nr:hypothetical protein [Myxococcales bacterium]